MVKLGFIVEGDSAAILVKHPSFIQFLNNLNIITNANWVINAQGKNNIFRINKDFHKIENKVIGWINTLYYKGVEKVITLIDMDDAPCYTYIKERSFINDTTLIIAKQELEAWYLADTATLNNYLNTKDVYIEYPEKFKKPIIHLKELRLKFCNKGINYKKILTTTFINNGFLLSNAAAHNNCTSAKYLLKKLEDLSN